MEYTYKTLKELADQFTKGEIISELCRRFLISNHAYFAFLDLIDRIKNAPEGTDCSMKFSFMVYKTKTGYDVYPAVEKNKRHYKLTYRNSQDIDKLAGGLISFRQDDFADSLIDTDTSDPLQLLVLILLSINAFSKAAVDDYFDGDIKNVDPIEYLVLAKEDRKKVKGREKAFLDNIGHWIS